VLVLEIKENVVLAMVAKYLRNYILSAAVRGLSYSGVNRHPVMHV